MNQHLFLTGPKGVGKSTLVRSLLAGHSGPIGGFFTQKVEHPGALPTVHLLRAGTDDTPGPHNHLFTCMAHDFGPATLERFARLGCTALAPADPPPTLLVMDEIGPHEAGCAPFLQRIFQALDGPVPILGVLQQADAPFLAQIAQHPNVRLVSVTLQNREGLAQSLHL